MTWVHTLWLVGGLAAHVGMFWFLWRLHVAKGEHYRREIKRLRGRDLWAEEEEESNGLRRDV